MAIAWIVGGIFDFIRRSLKGATIGAGASSGSIIGILAGIYIVANPALGTIFTLTIAFIFIAIAALINGMFNIYAGFKNEERNQLGIGDHRTSADRYQGSGS